MTLKTINELPQKAGKYDVQISGVNSFTPFSLMFDGTKWCGLEEMIHRYANGDINRIYYYS